MDASNYDVDVDEDYNQWEEQCLLSWPWTQAKNIDEYKSDRAWKESYGYHM